MLNSWTRGNDVRGILVFSLILSICLFVHCSLFDGIFSDSLFNPFAAQTSVPGEVELNPD